MLKMKITDKEEVKFDDRVKGTEIKKEQQNLKNEYPENKNIE